MRGTRMATDSDSHEGRFGPLSADQISQLTVQGCSCDDWSKVEVAEGFNANTVNATHFSVT